MAKVFEGQRTFMHPVLRWLEVLTYKVSGIREDVEQRWTHYTAALLSFSIFGFLLTYLLQRVQAYLPLNPQNFGTPVMPPDLAFNTATSFVTNTNWQAYSGESTMSYFVQMAALAVQNFASAAAGIAVAVALIRGFARTEKKTVGNFWVDVTRATVYVLLPISILAGLLYVSQGAIQNFKPYTQVTTVEGATQVIAQGPVASQEAIKQLGTNGGGYFNANSSHPVREPNAGQQPSGDVPDLRDSGRVDLHVRKNGGRYAPGVGHLRRLFGHVFDRRVRLLPLRAGGKSDGRQAGG